MRQNSLGKRIWELVYPILIYLGMEFLAEFVAVGIYYVGHMDAMIVAMQSEDGLMTFMSDVTEYISNYTTLITAISAAASLPILIYLKRRDDKMYAAAQVSPFEGSEREISEYGPSQSDYSRPDYSEEWSSRSDASGAAFSQTDASGPASLRKDAPRPKWTAYFLIVGICVPLCVALNNLITLSNLAAYSEAYRETAEALYAPPLLVELLCLGLVIPFAEEYLFRGLIYGRLRKYMKAGAAMIFSALIFAFIHGNLVQMLYAVVCGLLFAYVYEKYQSMAAPVTAHAVMNICSCVLSETKVFEWMFKSVARVGIITVVCAAMTSVMFLLIRNLNVPAADDEAKSA